MRVATVALLLLLAALQLQLWRGEGSRAELARLNEELALVKNEMARLQAGNTALDREVAALKAGPEAVEDRARSDLGLVAAGETFYLVVEH